MKKQLKYLFTALSMFVLMSSAYGQMAGSVELSSFTLDKGKNTVQVIIKTNDSFIAGANRYVLHIGSRYFQLSNHPDGRLDEIVFFLTLEEFNNLTNEGKIVLVYGYYYENTLKDNESEQNPNYYGKHWILGDFSPSLLKTN
jgi:hypothetical protein